MAERGNKKLVWYILFALIAVVFCYLFIVVFFYYVSPYDISLKITFWPFSSSKQIGNLYSDAIVDVRVDYLEEGSFDPDDIKHADITGVNVRKDGVIVVPYSEIKKCENVQSIKVMHIKSGGGYVGEMIYSSKDYNLALIKCKNLDGSDKQIKLPFVKETAKEVSSGNEVIVTSSNLVKSSVWLGNVTGTDMLHAVVKVDDENNKYLSYTMEQGYAIKIDYGNLSFNGGAVFDRYAHLLGFSFEDTLEVFQDQQTTFYIQSTKALPLFLDEALKAYENGKAYPSDFVKSFVGFDSEEAHVMYENSIIKEGKRHIYFNDAWREISDNLQQYLDVQMDGYYLYEKFEYNGKILNAGAVVTGITINSTKFDVAYKTELFDALFKCKKGDSVTIHYQLFQETEYKPQPGLVVVV